MTYFELLLLLFELIFVFFFFINYSLIIKFITSKILSKNTHIGSESLLDDDVEIRNDRLNFNKNNPSSLPPATLYPNNNTCI